jgi:hypothetical protein
MMEDRSEQFKRDVAYKTSVSQILNSELVDIEGRNALNVGGKLIKRVNLFATVIGKENDGGPQKNIIIDDGEGQIKLRFFNDEGLFEKASVGDFVLVVGKARHYNGEKYIVPEIMKTITDLKWAELRNEELRKDGVFVVKEGPVSETVEEGPKKVEEDVAGKDKIELYNIIKSLDAGGGADMTEVATKSGKSDSEKLMREMISSGDVFEVLPGKVKVLE